MMSGRGFLTDVEVPYATSGSYHSNRRSGVIPYIGFFNRRSVLRLHLLRRSRN